MDKDSTRQAPGQTLKVIPGCFAVSRLNANDEIPAWVDGEFYSVTRTGNELSIVCEQRFVPRGIESETNWSVLEVSGPLEFTEVGVLYSLAAPLADAGISIFVLSTFDTDYLLVAKDKLNEAKIVLAAAGHSIISD